MFISKIQNYKCSVWEYKILMFLLIPELATKFKHHEAKLAKKYALFFFVDGIMVLWNNEITIHGLYHQM